ncbi:response regulator [Desulfopila sp. IMCC35006]|uniref:response regulator n=1 Tax=Desulfopila sp. IMCC35006 TaxID=2569542 RepID=UPI0010AB718A|nr:response regulator [Desulfopila sp. IMCC35006]TKB24805.1 response regulator [Desulfopila sp. IMCC35006]
MDIKIASQQKQPEQKPCQQPLTGANDMPCGLAENITMRQRHGENPKQGSPRPSSGKILVVDDSNENRDILEIFLGVYGYDVISTCNGDEAWYLFLKEKFDLVLTDICMPGLDGNALASRIKNRSKGLPIIAITGSTWLAEECFDEIMTKPVWLHALLNSITFHLNKASTRAGTEAVVR